MTRSPSSQTGLYPLRFAPIYEYRPWGGKRLAGLLGDSLQDDDTVGEAWVLSDREGYLSRVVEGPLEGTSLRDLMEQFPDEMLGKMAKRFTRFPLLLKFLDARRMLSVQVHPSDRHVDYLPGGETGKTEAWVILEAEPQCRIYAGLKPDTTPALLRRALDDKTVTEHLSYFTPKPGDGVFLAAGTVHAFGDGVVVFEVQQNSDVTYRLYDWDHVDPHTGRPRDLQVEAAIACIDFSQGAVAPVQALLEETEPVIRERLFDSEHFCLWRLHGHLPCSVGAPGSMRALVCIAGTGQLEHNGETYAVKMGDVIVVPAVVGQCVFRPRGVVSLLEIALPEER